MSKVIQREACPSCRAKGNDRSGDNLVCYEDGSKHCFACAHHEHADGIITRQYQLPETVPFRTNKWKGIEPKILERYNVALEADSYDDGRPVLEKQPDGTYIRAGSDIALFPYYNWDDGKLIGAKCRDLAEPKEMWFDDHSDTSKLTFFGVNTISNSCSKLILCEGESDTLSMKQAMGDEYDVLGVPGASSITNALKKSLHHIRKHYKKVVLCFDNDDAGRKAQDDAIALLPPGMAWTTQFPNGYNDVNELLIAQKKTEIRRIISEAKQVVPKGIIDENEMISQSIAYYRNKQRGGVPTGFSEFDKAFGGVVPGKLYTVIGETGCGKSTFVEQVAVNVATQQDMDVFVLSLEMSAPEVHSRMVQNHTQIPFVRVPDMEVSDEQDEQIIGAYHQLGHKVRFYNQIGGQKIDDLIGAMHYAIDAFDTKLIILDNFTSASETLGWEALEQFAKRVKNEICVGRNVCVLGVAHVSRDKNRKDGEPPRLSDVRGSNGIAQQSDAMLSIGRRIGTDDPLKCVTVKTERSRGAACEFYLKMENCKLFEVEGKRSNDEEDSEEERLVPKSVRSAGRRGKRTERGAVRSKEAAVRVEQKVHAGLHTTTEVREEAVHRDEGISNEGRQTKAKSSQTDVSAEPGGDSASVPGRHAPNFSFV